MPRGGAENDAPPRRERVGVVPAPPMKAGGVDSPQRADSKVASAVDELVSTKTTSPLVSTKNS